MKFQPSWAKAVVWMAVLTQLSCAHRDRTEFADTIYLGGDILTMAGREPEYVEALAVKDSRIVHVGSRALASKLESDTTEVVDLMARLLLPGFIDSHSHFVQTAIKLSTVNLDPPSSGSVT